MTAGWGWNLHPRPGTPAAALEPPRSGMVKLVSENGSALTLIRNGDIDGSGGVGGWQSSERVLREDADWWKSLPKITRSIPCLLDVDALGGPSLERRLEVLFAMGAPDDDDDPPPLRVLGDIDPIAKARRLKIDDIRLAAQLFREDDPSALRRQELTLELSSFTESRGVSRVTVKRTRDSHGKRRRRTIIARRGDTLRAIAVRQLGSSGDYKLIRSWNPKLKRVDPDAPLRAGTKVVLH
jgi:hypothetical protein